MTQPPRSRQPPTQWSHGLFDSPLDGSMATGCCCPCILYGKTQDRMRDPTGQTHETFNGDCFKWFCLGACISAPKRTEYREKYNIEGSSGNDWCVSCCLPCYSLTQMDNDVVTRQRGAAGANTAGYQSNQPMEMAPPQ